MSPKKLPVQSVSASVEDLSSSDESDLGTPPAPLGSAIAAVEPEHPLIKKGVMKMNKPAKGAIRTIVKKKTPTKKKKFIKRRWYPKKLYYRKKKTFFRRRRYY
jgi:hypothetical protein